MPVAHSTIYWSTIEYNSWKIHIAKTEKGLCCVGSPGESLEEFTAYFKKRFPSAILERNDRKLADYSQELTVYLEGSQQEFSLPTDVQGTPFQQQTWQALKQIPYGQTLSYSEIAERIGRPSAVRAVATAIGANPLLIIVPCHRVIGKNGTMAGYRGGLAFKRLLLDLETQKLPAK
ncbi:methylated-DNA-[protein]-cysteine S-methyltransferase [Planomicrobium stackebrandtii]|uniref:Methylated-DNA-[protein]-cysteine S-methyltransferase n=1 Tax=Planomicrobium stackebrandtii TaxID=253160 RepID=A0ABU0GYE2_9BACL|nr:methylated-DNA--[protein]-cysteine S-methyltransferase [Planomicrobium stackebrandtii]MDQ0429816.1 methylated-DNA-[protein]-cysteine S-methyltransferase [Planomicrobium stackebrandtii]